MTTNTQATDQSLLDRIYAQDHVVITAKLTLRNGHFFQPTGFPDIGACVYRDKEGRRWCLVESEQSMSNRLEAVCMKSPGVWVDDLKGLPLVAVRNTARDLLATNLTEPHRIASSHVLEGRTYHNQPLGEIAKRRIGINNGIWPLQRRADLEKLVFALDPGALLHGFQFIDKKFFESFVGLRHVRLLHARLEAELPETDPEVHYQMVKFDQIQADPEKETNKGQSIAPKSRVVPKQITATFEIDVLGLKSLSLQEDQKKFLLGLGLWKIGAFLANRPSFDPRSRSTGPSLRLRADCYLVCGDSISWSGSSSAGTTSTGELMEAKTTGVSFRPLVDEVLSDEQDKEATSKKTKGIKSRGKKAAATEKEFSATENAEPLYDGPLVEVTYEPRPKQDKKGGGKDQQPTASDGQEEEV